MVKAALGKGMKDLINKNFGISEDGPDKDDDKAKEELKTSIDRYQAQGFDISLLKALEGKDAKDILKGISEFREAIKKISAAKTVIKSLEPYGYTEEIEQINQDIQDPKKADIVLKNVDELRARMMDEHNVQPTKKETPKVKLPQELGKKAERIMAEEGGQPDTEDLDPEALDELMSELEDIGEAFDITEEEMLGDPELLDKIRDWELQGLFVDKIKSLLREDPDKARAEVENFEKDLKELLVQKERFENMDMSNFKKQAEELNIKFQYPNMANEIKNELDLMEKYLKELEKETEEPQKPEPEEIPPEEAPPSEAEVEVEPEQESPEAEDQDDIPEAEEHEDEPQQTEEEAPSEDAPPTQEPETQEAAPSQESEFAGFDTEQLMEMAKEAYRNGDTEASLKYFEEILRRDPENSKARFMKRRLSSKS